MAALGSSPVSSHTLVRRRGPILLVLGALVALWSCGGDQLTDPASPQDPDPNGDDPPAAEPGLEVSVQLEEKDRLELTDSLVIHVQALDPSGVNSVDTLGFSAIVSHDGETVGRMDHTLTGANVGDTVQAAFSLHPDWLTRQDLPVELGLEIFGWAVSSDGECRVALEESDSLLECRNEGIGGQTVRIGTDRPSQVGVMAVPGRTTAFTTSSITVGDLQVDTLRERAYISNRLSNRLHVFDPVGFGWNADVSVGSEPWGLHLNSTGDTLLVANSGGTSVSHVSLAGTPAEVVSNRLQTRNTVLFEIGLLDEEEAEEDPDDEDRPTVAGEVRFFDFSDRPQYVSQDGGGRILYSTRPTSAAPLGTVRVIEHQAGWVEHETRMLARLPKDARSADGTVSVMNVDSIVPYVGGAIEIWDHEPGFPDRIIRSGIRPPMEAIEFMANQTASDIDYQEDFAWELEAVSFADTTYVATSRDRSFVAFGDGGEPDVGRVVLWHSPSATISRRLTVADLVNNASERVRALQLNDDGSLGIARGAFGTYFFSNDLRLRGTIPETADGGGGAALHPDHPNTPAPSASSATTVAFTISGDRAIRILDTVHYQERGYLPIRDGIAGPMRVTPPLPSDNNGQGRNCSGSDCVVAKVFAVTDSGGVTVVDVRSSDIQPVP
jgi:hypothetical protein